MNAFRRFCLSVSFSIGVTLLASPDLSTPIPELRLIDGVVLREVSIKSYARKGVMIRHSEGFAQIAYDKFPAEYRDALLAKRPAGGDVTATGASNSNVSVVKAVPSVGSGVTRDTNSRAGQRLGLIDGAILLRQGKSQAPVPDVEVRVYRTEEFVDWDLSRLRSFGPQHAATRERFNGRSAMGTVSAAEQLEFFSAEYDSWEGVPKTPYIARTDINGAFSLAVPEREDLIVFARIKREVGNGVFAYYVWAVKLNGQPSIVLNNGNTYPALKMAAP